MPKDDVKVVVRSLFCNEWEFGLQKNGFEQFDAQGDKKSIVKRAKKIARWLKMSDITIIDTNGSKEIRLL